MILVWLVHVGIGGALSAPVVFLGRKRVHWRRWELAAFVVPFGVWLAPMFLELSTGRKTLANLGERTFFSLAIPVAALLRVAVGVRFSERALAAGLIAVLSSIAAAIFFLVPALPE